MVSGALDDVAATEISAVLMTLDGVSDEPVDVRIGSTGGSLAASMMVADTIDAMRARVVAVATGALTGPAVVILAVGHDRAITPTTLVTTSLDHDDLGAMTAADAAIAAAAHVGWLEAFTARLARSTAVDADEWRARFERGSVLSPDEVVAVGLADRVGLP